QLLAEPDYGGLADVALGRHFRDGQVNDPLRLAQDEVRDPSHRRAKGRTQRADLAEQRALSHRLDRRHKTHLPDEKISSIALMCRWRYSPDPCNFLLAQVPARQGISSDHPGGAAAGPWETALLLRSVFGYTGWEAEDGRRR